MPSSAPHISSNAFKSLPRAIREEGASDDAADSMGLQDTSTQSDSTPASTYPSTSMSSPCATYVESAAARHQSKGASSKVSPPAAPSTAVSISDMLRPGAEVNPRKPKASDYVDVVHALILRAASEYESLIVTRDAFPDTAMQNKWAKLAWKNAGLAADESYPLLDSINLLVRVTLISHHCSKNPSDGVCSVPAP